MAIAISEEDKQKFRDLSRLDEANLVEHLAKALFVVVTCFGLWTLSEVQQMSTKSLHQGTDDDSQGQVAYVADTHSKITKERVKLLPVFDENG